MDGMSRKRDEGGVTMHIFWSNSWVVADLFLGGVCYEKLKSATIALIFPCHQHNAREKWAKYSQPYVQTHCVRNLNLIHKTFGKRMAITVAYLEGCRWVLSTHRFLDMGAEHPSILSKISLDVGTFKKEILLIRTHYF